MLIGSPYTYLTRNGARFRGYSISGVPVIGYLRGSHVNYARFNGFILYTSFSFKTYGKGYYPCRFVQICFWNFTSRPCYQGSLDFKINGKITPWILRHSVQFFRSKSCFLFRLKKLKSKDKAWWASLMI